MIIGVIYTSTTPEMIKLIEKELRGSTEENIEIISYINPTIIRETIENGSVTNNCSKKLIKMYMDAVTAGAEIVYNICSSVGDIADSMKMPFEHMGVPLVRIDEEMAIRALNSGGKIGVLATLKTTLEPTKRLVNRWAKEMNINVHLEDALAEGAFGKSGEELENILINTALNISGKVDVIILAQASMTSCEEKIALATGKKVYSSPRYGALAVSKEIAKIKNKVCK